MEYTTFLNLISASVLGAVTITMAHFVISSVMRLENTPVMSWETRSVPMNPVVKAPIAKSVLHK